MLQRVGYHAKPVITTVPLIVVIYGYMMGLYYRYNITGWWLSPTPLKNDGVRQLGL
jgi:preprotein translocase subunit Sec63